ncbi:MarR family transcriptional regulator [Ammonicoccus fulvus]|uniref:MarR family transcriptional regulator n=1 Tax=Ammonicoccus fulvus TaxID=3138240 RepID=A0ABZ3FIM9_9ACTN
MPSNIAAEWPLSRLLLAAAELTKSTFAEAVAERGLTSQQARAMFILGDSPRTMREMAEFLRCDASNITGIADRLTAQGFLERVADPTDRRVKRLELTPDGRDAVDALGVHLQDSPGITQRLTDAERDQLTTLLRKLLEDPPTDE